MLILCADFVYQVDVFRAVEHERSHGGTIVETEVRNDTITIIAPSMCIMGLSFV